MSTFTVAIDATGTAFRDDADAEIAAVLRRLATRVECGDCQPEPGGARYDLTDSYGKIVGHAKVGAGEKR